MNLAKIKISIVLVISTLSSAAWSADLTYPEIVRIIGSNKNVRARLVGQTATVNLIASGPDSLMVNPKDMTFFDCKQRNPAYAKAGTITARITNYTTDPDGNPVITLDKCSQ